MGCRVWDNVALGGRPGTPCQGPVQAGILGGI